MARVNVSVVDNNNVTLRVVPPASNIIELNRGIVGPQGPSGESNIGGYPINIATAPQDYNALMFVSGAWTNVPQTEITDGGNF